jgi:hypothetical protein
MADPSLARAVDIEREVRQLNERIKTLEDERQGILADAMDAGLVKEEHPWGVYRLIVKPGRITRVLDVEAFKASFPKAYRKIVQTSVRLSDAEREVGKANLGTVVSIREGTATAAIEFEPAAIAIPVQEVGEP